MNGIVKTTTPAGIVVKPQVRFGKPCIRGTRIAVTDLLGLLQRGYNVQDIPTQYPGVTASNARIALRYATRILGKEEVLEIGAA